MRTPRYLIGAGCTLDALLSDPPLGQNTHRSIRCVMSRLGLGFRERLVDLSALLDPADLAALNIAARRRRVSAIALAGQVLHFVLIDDLLRAVIDADRPSKPVRKRKRRASTTTTVPYRAVVEAERITELMTMRELDLDQAMQILAGELQAA